VQLIECNEYGPFHILATNALQNGHMFPLIFNQLRVNWQKPLQEGLFSAQGGYGSIRSLLHSVPSLVDHEDSSKMERDWTIG